MVFTRSSKRLSEKNTTSTSKEAESTANNASEDMDHHEPPKKRTYNTQKKSSSSYSKHQQQQQQQQQQQLQQQQQPAFYPMFGQPSKRDYPYSQCNNDYYCSPNYNEMMHHADVRFRPLPFYELMEEIIRPTSIHIDRGASRIQSCITFVLSPKQVKSIHMDQVHVLLRICLEETTCEQNDHYPMHFQIYVNDSVCPLPVQPPSNKPVVERKSPSEPLNIKRFLRTSPFASNKIIVYADKDYQKYAATVIIVQKVSSMDLLRKLRNKGTKHADFTRSLIKEKLREDVDCEIATTSLRVSLNCPLGKMRMMYPCRASTCSHLQCFDASLFLQMNERKPTWVCPVCDKPALYNNLVVDGYFQEVLSSSSLSRSCNEIQLHKDGSWSPHSKKEFDKVEILPKPVEVIQLDMDVIPICDSSNEDSSNGAGSVKQVAVSSTTQPQAQIVDLTSDSDDDLPLKKRFCKNYNPETNEVECSVLTPETVSSDVTPTPSTIYPVSASPTDDPIMTPDMYHNTHALEMAVSSIISLDSPSPPCSPVVYEPQVDILDRQPTADGHLPSLNLEEEDIVESPESPSQDDTVDIDSSPKEGEDEENAILPEDFNSQMVAEFSQPETFEEIPEPELEPEPESLDPAFESQDENEQLN